ncbi:MAG: EcsC family protein [Gammaproteobacteria bacterium]|nr:EcsC family protein [Gammaproteobacteria bacterium]NBT43918.1 EcsC family protein [Gammaproteobacteria bacterium]NBY23277.1 EcsC family protein [Gammaproteobacteria bacterium]
MTDEDLIALQAAFEALEHPSFAARLNHVVGIPVESALKLLPPKWNRRIHRVADSCVKLALKGVIRQRVVNIRVADRGHKMVAMAVGAAGGFMGGVTLLMELPMTTTVMLSSITEIARREGEDLESVEAQMACLEIFALGGRSPEDDAAETGYYGARLALEAPIAEAARYLSAAGSAWRGHPPALVQVVDVVARRFGVVLTEKATAQIIPVIGALGGAFLNKLFIEHFQRIARGHFTIRRLERKYSPDSIQMAYEALKAPSRERPFLSGPRP